MNQTKSNIIIGAVMILLAAVLKLATYHNSFSLTPIIAIALFSGAVVSDKKLAFLMPLLAMFVADLLLDLSGVGIGFYGVGQIGNYVCLLFVTLLGFYMKKISVLSVAGFSIGSSLLFYFLSNSNTFIFDTFNMYERSFSGYIRCMALGLEFLKTRIPTDLFYSAVLFGSYVLMFKKTTTPRKVIA
ncbi:DUF6580 family putative transport protein [Ferruginibacter sp. HRS2-29]|uniref:DUF6580 family putative transport protein n=1 Tax=Ferruginibacter sp. HRS2-29 TaxID=2487334 RepID=UPI0020CD19EE|nr:DUF6580 family putative transport protein [Ferruginibacter sp. HRS2-29]MCP9749691.1 hypothetical protein [Ferruginibacter sp. HRS2-29]